MNDNSLFHIARARACDEFYTSLDVIEKEMDWQFSQDPDVFRGKTVRFHSFIKIKSIQFPVTDTKRSR